MKIVIDIPEREFSLYGSMVKMDMGNEAVRFIVKGKPLSEILDKISAEIEDELKDATNGTERCGMYNALRIIKKHKWDREE